APDPLAGGDLVEQAPVAAHARLLVAQVRMGGEPEHAQAVVDGDDDHIAAPRQCRAVVEGAAARTARETAAVHPHHHGAAAAVGGRGPHVEREAVLVLARLLAAQRLAAGRWRLRCPAADGERLAHAGPWRGRLRWAEPQGSDRRSGEGDPLEHSEPALVGSGQRTRRRLHGDHVGEAYACLRPAGPGQNGAMAESVTVWFNPRCSKCKGAEALLCERGVEAEYVPYLDTAPNRRELEHVLTLLGTDDPRAII